MTTKKWRSLRKILLWPPAWAMVLGICLVLFPVGALCGKAPLDINTAKTGELARLKGVGPALAKKIVAHRPYKSLEELGKAGLTPEQIEALKSRLTVGSPPASSSSEGGEADKLVRPQTAAAKGKSPEKLAPGQKVNLNTASQQELEKLPGIGPKKAQDIIAGRPYKNIKDLMKVKGIKKRTFEKLKDYLTVD
jgi:competence protein ComEA